MPRRPPVAALQSRIGPDPARAGAPARAMAERAANAGAGLIAPPERFQTPADPAPTAAAH